MKHGEGNFKGYKEYNIYYQYWSPETSTKAILLIAHGFAEHSGRYENVVNYFLCGATTGAGSVWAKI